MKVGTGTGGAAVSGRDLVVARTSPGVLGPGLAQVRAAVGGSGAVRGDVYYSPGVLGPGLAQVGSAVGGSEARFSSTSS